MKDDPVNYADSGHTATTPRVRRMMADWLADHIADILSSGSPD